MIFIRLAGICNSDEDNIAASDSDMEMNSADESAELQELPVCDEVCTNFVVNIFLNVEDIRAQTYASLRARTGPLMRTDRAAWAQRWDLLCARTAPVSV